MRIYHFLDVEILHKLKIQKQLICEEKYIDYVSKNHKFAYRWYRNEMKKLIPNCISNKNVFPFWGWFKFNNMYTDITFDNTSELWLTQEDSTYYSSLDKFNKDYDKQKNTVCVTLDLNPKDVLLTDHTNYHYILNKIPYGKTLNDVVNIEFFPIKQPHV